MASVQYLFSFSQNFSCELVTVQRHLQEVINFREPFIIQIQSTWRGYAVYKNYQRIRKSIITIQSFYRGWKVRINKEAHLKRHEYYLGEIRKSTCAIKIQSWWRGIIARKYIRLHSGLPRDRLNERKRVQKVNEKMAAEIREMIKINKLKEQEAIDDRNQREALFILYKCHHLLRTCTREGIYSCNGSKELSLIETLMKALPCKDYMDNLHSLYKELVKIDQKPTYRFKKKAFRNLEDALRHSIEQEEKELKFDVSETLGIHNKPFKLSPKLDKPPHIPRLFVGDHKRKEKSIDPELLERERKFRLHTRVLDLKDRNEPYYIDYWEKEVFGKESGSKNIC